MTDIPWWEMPKLTYRPQYLQLTYLLQELQPSAATRVADLRLAAMDEPAID
jgi:hypothetical protein